MCYPLKEAVRKVSRLHSHWRFGSSCQRHFTCIHSSLHPSKVMRHCAMRNKRAADLAHQRSCNSALPPREMSHEPDRCQYRGNSPQRHDHARCNATDWALAGRCGRGAMLTHHLNRDKPHCQRQGERHQHYVVDIAKHGNEIGNQVNGRQGIGGDQRAWRFRIPWRAGILCSQPYGVRLIFYCASPTPGACGQMRQQVAAP